MSVEPSFTLSEPKGVRISTSSFLPLSFSCVVIEQPVRATRENTIGKARRVTGLGMTGPSWQVPSADTLTDNTLADREKFQVVEACLPRKQRGTLSMSGSQIEASDYSASGFAPGTRFLRNAICPV